jgi:probable phosphoglycerate mutase
MSTFVLIRHGSTDHVGKILSGTRKGVHLNGKGLHQVRDLIHSAAAFAVAAVYSSPLERAVETAEPIARTLRVPLVTVTEITELEFGDWTGKSFTELDCLQEWHSFNAARSYLRAPGGECLEDAQRRVMPFLEKLSRHHNNDAVILVTHADIIKTIVLTSLGAPLDCLHRFSIDPASITVIESDGRTSLLKVLNLAPALPMASRLQPFDAG